MDRDRIEIQASVIIILLSFLTINSVSSQVADIVQDGMFLSSIIAFLYSIYVLLDSR